MWGIISLEGAGLAERIVLTDNNHAILRTMALLHQLGKKQPKKEEVIRHAWGKRNDNSENSWDRAIQRLRKRLKDGGVDWAFIETKRGVVALYDHPVARESLKVIREDGVLDLVNPS